MSPFICSSGADNHPFFNQLNFSFPPNILIMNIIYTGYKSKKAKKLKHLRNFKLTVRQHNARLRSSFTYKSIFSQNHFPT